MKDCPRLQEAQKGLSKLKGLVRSVRSESREKFPLGRDPDIKDLSTLERISIYVPVYLGIITSIKPYPSTED